MLSPICYGVQVIKGLDQGIFGGEGVPPMQVGKVLKLTICSFVNSHLHKKKKTSPHPTNIAQGENGSFTFLQI